MSAAIAAPAAATNPVQQQTQPATPADEGDYIPLNRCKFALAAVVSIGYLAKSIFMTLLTLVGATVCLGQNKKMNACLSAHGKGIFLALIASIISVTGIICPGCANKELGRNPPTNS